MIEQLISHLGLIGVILLVLGAEFVNGATDAPNAIATVVSTRVLPIRLAVLLAVVLNTVGALSGTAVAITIAKGILDPSAPLTLATVAAAMVAIIVWSSLTWRVGIPTSETHALLAGLAGAGMASAGPGVLLWEGWQKVLIGIAFSTFLGFGLGWLIMSGVLAICRWLKPETVRRSFGRLQLFSAGFMAFAHGSNDGQKFMGAFVLALILGGAYPRHLVVQDAGDTQLVVGSLISPDELKAASTLMADDARRPTTRLRVPPWVIVLCASVMGLGTSLGGLRIIRTIGMRMVKLKPQHGFAAETAAAGAIQLATGLSIPLSTTHTISMAILGVGSMGRLSAVRWGVVEQIVWAWVITFPACGAMGYAVAWVLEAL